MSDHFAISVASADFYAAALHIMDHALFTVLQKIDLMVVPATLKLRSPISCIYAQLILISMHQNTI